VVWFRGVGISSGPRWCALSSSVGRRRAGRQQAGQPAEMGPQAAELGRGRARRRSAAAFEEPYQTATVRLHVRKREKGWRAVRCHFLVNNLKIRLTGVPVEL
jgi:hypothetical protein